MTFPVFASGDVLNASDMNAVGLWLVKTQTIGTAVSSVAVTGAFSSDYENYKIIVSGGIGSTNTSIALTLGSTATGYYAYLMAGVYNSTTFVPEIDNNATSWTDIGSASANSIHTSFELFSPNLAKRTHLISHTTQSRTTGFFAMAGGFLDDSNAYTSFTLTPSAPNTLTGGTIRVYGYRN